MKSRPTDLPGVWEVFADVASDERGHFFRLSDSQMLSSLVGEWVGTYSAISHNFARHTLRGMHWQSSAAPETKLVRCVRGSALDVVVDVDTSSSTFGRWTAVELDADRANAVLIGPLHAHGFLTLEDSTDVLYEIRGSYEPGHSLGFRWDDPMVGLDWPAVPAVIGRRDAALPPLGVLDPQRLTVPNAEETR